MKTCHLLILGFIWLMAGCTTNTVPDFTPIRQGLGFLGLSLILAALIQILGARTKNPKPPALEMKNLEIYLPSALLLLFVVIALRALYEAVGPLILPVGALALTGLAVWLWLRFKS